MLKFIKNLFVSDKENKKKTVETVCDWDRTVKAYDYNIQCLNNITKWDKQNEDVKAALYNMDTNRKYSLEKLKALREEFVKRNPDVVNTFAYEEMLRDEAELSISHVDRYRDNMENYRRDSVLKTLKAKAEFMQGC